MQKSSLPAGVKTLMNWKAKGTLTFDNPIQRASSQWNLLQKSLLIHSMLADYIIPAVYLIKSKRESDGVTIYDCLDSKQRLTSVFDFIDGGYALHGSTPEVVVDGVTYDLANMKFEDLSDECKDIITGFRFNISCIEDATEEEIEDIFSRLNNSTPLSPIQKARTVMGTNLARWTKDICAMDFFQHSISLTLAQSRRESDLEVLLQAMLLLSSREGKYTEWKGISTAEVTKYCKYIRNNYGDDELCDIMSIIDFLDNAFSEQHKFLKKSNVPTVIVLAKIALENDIEPAEFKGFIDVFSNCVCPEYDENCGSGNVKRVKTEGRLRAIAKKFEEYFNLEDVSILGARGVASEPSEKPSREEVMEDATEKQELPTEQSSSDDQSNEETENNEESEEDSNNDQAEEQDNPEESEVVSDERGEDSFLPTED